MTTPRFPEPPPPLKFPLLRPKARIWLEGPPGRRGSVIIEEEHAVVKQFTLSAAQYSVLYALAEKSLEDISLPPWKSLRGFLAKEQFQKRLSEWGISGWYRNKHVYNTRKTLSRKIGQVGAMDGWLWAHEFLETSEVETYRLSLPPENVFIG